MDERAGETTSLFRHRGLVRRAMRVVRLVLEASSKPTNFDRLRAEDPSLRESLDAPRVVPALRPLLDRARDERLAILFDEVAGLIDEREEAVVWAFADGLFFDDEHPAWPSVRKLARLLPHLSGAATCIRLKPTVEQRGAWILYAGGTSGGAERRVYSSQIQKCLEEG